MLDFNAVYQEGGDYHALNLGLYTMVTPFQIITINPNVKLVVISTRSHPINTMPDASLE